MKEEDQYITLKSYSNIWKVERVVHHLGGTSIPATKIERALYIAVIAVFEVILWVLIPPLRKIPMIVYLAAPFLLSAFLLKVQLDGKNPLKFFESLINYILSPKAYVRFRPVRKNEIASYDGMIPYRLTNTIVQRIRGDHIGPKDTKI